MSETLRCLQYKHEKIRFCFSYVVIAMLMYQMQSCHKIQFRNMPTCVYSQNFVKKPDAIGEPLWYNSYHVCFTHMGPGSIPGRGEEYK